MLGKINSVCLPSWGTDLGNALTGKEFGLSKWSTISLPLMRKQSWLQVFNSSSYRFSKTETQQHLTFALSYLSNHEPVRRVKGSGWLPGHIPTQNWSFKDNPCLSNWHVFECIGQLAQNSSPTLPPNNAWSMWLCTSRLYQLSLSAYSCIFVTNWLPLWAFHSLREQYI